MNQQKILTSTADLISGAAIVGTLMQWLPPLAAIGGIIWYAIQIWESKTVQKRVRVWRARSRIKRRAIQVLKAQLTLDRAEHALENAYVAKPNLTN